MLYKSAVRVLHHPHCKHQPETRVGIGRPVAKVVRVSPLIHIQYVKGVHLDGNTVEGGALFCPRP